YSGLHLYHTVPRVFTEVQFFFANFQLSAMWIEHVIQWLASVPHCTPGIYRSSVFLSTFRQLSSFSYVDRARHPVACICTTLYPGYLQKFSFFVNFSPTFIFHIYLFTTLSYCLQLFYSVLCIIT